MSCIVYFWEKKLKIIPKNSRLYLKTQKNSRASECLSDVKYWTLLRLGKFIEGFKDEISYENRLHNPCLGEKTQDPTEKSQKTQDACLGSVVPDTYCLWSRQASIDLQRWEFLWESITQPVPGRKNSRSHRKISKNSRRLSGKCDTGYLLPLVQTSLYWASEMRILMRIDYRAHA